MGLKLKPKSSENSGGGEYERCPAGTFGAVLVAIIQLGHHPEKKTNSKTGAEKMVDTPKVYFCWEIPSEKQANGKPHVIGHKYTESLHEKSALRKMIETWRSGKPLSEDEEFDLSVMIGKPCLLTVTLTEGGYPKIGGVSGLPRGMAAEKPTYPLLVWEIDGNVPPPQLDWLPYIYGNPVDVEIKASTEWKEKTGQTRQQASPPQHTSRSVTPEEMGDDGDDNGDEIPF